MPSRNWELLIIQMQPLLKRLKAQILIWCPIWPLAMAFWKESYPKQLNTKIHFYSGLINDQIKNPLFPIAWRNSNLSKISDSQQIPHWRISYGIRNMMVPLTVIISIHEFQQFNQFWFCRRWFAVHFPVSKSYSMSKTSRRHSFNSDIGLF